MSWKKISLLIVVILLTLLSGVNATSIVARTDSLAIPFSILDSLGRPVDDATGDSVFIVVMSPYGAEVFSDSMLFSDGRITEFVWEDYGNQYVFSDLVSDIDGSSTTEGVYTWHMLIHDQSLGLQTPYQGFFQIINDPFYAMLDSIGITGLIAEDILDTLQLWDTRIDSIEAALADASIGDKIWTDGAFTNRFTTAEQDSVIAALADVSIGDKVWTDPATRTLSATQTFSNTGTWTGNLTGSVGSVTGAVGSVTGAVGSVTADVTLADAEHGLIADSVWFVDTTQVQSTLGSVGRFVMDSSGQVSAGSVTAQNMADIADSVLSHVDTAWASGTFGDQMLDQNDTLKLIEAEVVNIDAWNPITDNDSLIVDQSSLEDMSVATVTGNVDGSVASVTADVTLADGEFAIMADSLWQADTLTHNAVAGSFGEYLYKPVSTSLSAADAAQIADSVWLADFEAHDGTAGSFGDSAQAWGETSASSLDSGTVSRIMHRVGWGTPKGSGSDSSTLAERDVTGADFLTGSIDADAIATDAIGTAEWAASLELLTAFYTADTATYDGTAGSFGEHWQKLIAGGSTYDPTTDSVIVDVSSAMATAGLADSLAANTADSVWTDPSGLNLTNIPKAVRDTLLDNMAISDTTSGQYLSSLILSVANARDSINAVLDSVLNLFDGSAQLSIEKLRIVAQYLDTAVVIEAGDSSGTAIFAQGGAKAPSGEFYALEISGSDSSGGVRFKSGSVGGIGTRYNTAFAVEVGDTTATHTAMWIRGGADGLGISGGGNAASDGVLIIGNSSAIVAQTGTSSTDPVIDFVAGAATSRHTDLVLDSANLSDALKDSLAIHYWNLAFNTAYDAGSMGDSLNNSSYVQGTAGSLDSTAVYGAVEQLIADSLGVVADAVHDTAAAYPAVFYGPTATGSGAGAISVYAVDSVADDTLTGITIAVYNTAGALVANSKTGSTGYADFNLDDGTYYFLGNAYGYAWPPDTTAIVASAGVDTTGIEGAAYPVVVSASDSICAVTINVKGGNGAARPGVWVTCNMGKNFAIDWAGNAVVNVPQRLKTDANGQATFYCLYSSAFDPDVKWVIATEGVGGIRRSITVPSSASYTVDLTP